MLSGSDPAGRARSARTKVSRTIKLVVFFADSSAWQVAVRIPKSAAEPGKLPIRGKAALRRQLVNQAR